MKKIVLFLMVLLLSRLSRMLRLVRLCIGIPMLLFFVTLHSGLAADLFAQEAKQKAKKESTTKTLEKYLKTSFAVKETYDDNIFLAPSNKKDDWITSFISTTLLRLPMGRNSIQMGYSGNYQRYDNYDKYSAYNQTVTGLLNLNFASGLYIIADDALLYTKDPPSSEVVSRVKRLHNTSRAVLGYKATERFSVETSYANIFQDYRAADYKIYDYMEHVIGSTLYYRFMPKTSFLVEYDFGKVDYDKGNRSSHYHQILGGLQGHPTAKMTVDIKAGGQFRDYKEKQYKNFNGYVFNAKVTDTFTPSTTFTLFGQKSVQESLYGTINYYDELLGTVGLSQKIGPKFVVALKGSLAQNSYPQRTTEDSVTKKRRDYLWSAEATLNYDIQKWLSIGGGYKYRERNSNFGNFDYKNHQVMCEVTTKF